MTKVEGTKMDKMPLNSQMHPYKLCDADITLTKIKELRQNIL